MAANLKSRGLASLGKRFVGQIHSRDPVSAAPYTLRSIHNSTYDKNVDENTHSTVVPDHLMPPQVEEYWAPHPKTGVFGPSSDDKQSLGLDSGGYPSAESVLEQKAFFRPLEDLEKPQVQP
ncbi:Unknown protein [Striga hermonthica]|uniref:Late embryogenesis abundant protein n=1 Tax=Striga hermonthica TaxID=68872 RepID=A0A9N7MQV5_STRHE|nr:Unknown protein [Striga hermonthica]